MLSKGVFQPTRYLSIGPFFFIVVCFKDTLKQLNAATKVLAKVLNGVQYGPRDMRIILHPGHLINSSNSEISDTSHFTRIFCINIVITTFFFFLFCFN